MNNLDLLKLPIPNYENAIDIPPSSAHACNDEFNNISLDAKWSWINQGTATVIIENKKLKMIDPIDGATTDLHCLVQTTNVPTGNFTLTAKLNLYSMPVNYIETGIFFMNSSNGKIVSISAISQASYFGMGLIRYNSTTSWNSNTLLSWAKWEYYRIQKTGTNLKYYVSENGELWYLVGTDAISSFISAVDSIGVFSDNQNTSYDVYAYFDWFRVVED